ncbi:TspO/MBR family protein [Carnobacterium divergens]|uniref:TspO/MBR family protein n=1 Tax=Carnobacterium divergens TaxID=2748 RepID=UPI002891E210|nr:TspO/MBR family protein [Carnobacterium divergens]MDT1939045.1 tryptophan-rich sensory protein [Carnobacterium divergens]MDT1941483.1 tryptophan-rich sensory protein [Carnobacterium divergens]MDT1947281.1 tryptophan-rich sensory protein [Carnobacterium divergens]MDT1949719.1 tryptophan-rich sensory protein [Carnobacterium divergens]MDT1954897.1 tryptophan-rich sensory protein [Carnobacterium divergens]
MRLTRIIKLYLAFGVTLLINALATIIPINGLTTGEISNQFTVYFTPAGYVFSIWGIIYLALFLWLLSFSLKRQVLTTNLYWGFLMSSLANSLWILFWQYRFPGVSILVILFLFVSLLWLYRSQLETGNSWIYLLPISIYLGWVSVATLANISYWLVAVVGIHPFFQGIVALIFLVLTTVIGFGALHYLRNWAIIGVYLWALYGIFIHNLAINWFIAIVALGLTILLAVVTIGYVIEAIKKRPKESSKKEKRVL